MQLSCFSFLKYMQSTLNACDLLMYQLNKMKIKDRHSFKYLQAGIFECINFKLKLLAHSHSQISNIK